MNKDEMKNRISIALKDPILQLGFEIICKQNAELEKENAALKEDLKSKDLALEDFSKWSDGQLTKAKGIIKGLLESCFGPTSKTVNYEVKARAEQFLKED